MSPIYRPLFILLSILFIAAVFILLNIVVSTMEDNFLNKKISKKLNKLNMKDIKRDIKKDIENKQYISKRKNSKYIRNLALLIQQSEINEKYKFITPQFLIFSSFVIGILVFILSQAFIKILVPSIIIGIIGYKVPVILLNILVAVNANKLTKKLIDFINLIRNFCMIDNNIVTAIANSSIYMKDPIKSICEDFKHEINHGINSYDALEHIKYRLNSKQYNLLIKNLQICSLHTNNYLDVLSKSEKLIMSYSKEQLSRMKELSRGVSGIISLIIASAIICLLLLNINPGLVAIIRTNIIGQGIMTMISFTYLIAIFIVEKLAKLDF